MVEIPEPYVRRYPLAGIEKEDMLELFYLFRSAPLSGLAISANIAARGSTYILEDEASGQKIEQELKEIIRNREKIITGFAIQATQKIDAPPPQISVSLRLGKEEAKLTIIRPRETSRKDLFTLDGLEEGISKILAKKPRQADRILDSPYTLLAAALAAGLLASRMPVTGLDPMSAGLIAAALIALLWLANKYRAYKTCHVIFSTDGDEDMFRHLNRTIRKYSREIIGGVITLSISLIVLFISWFFQLA